VQNGLGAFAASRVARGEADAAVARVDVDDDEEQEGKTRCGDE